MDDTSPTQPPRRLPSPRRSKAQRAAVWAQGQNHILALMAQGESLQVVLDAIARLAERRLPGLLCSVLRLDGKTLRHGAAPRLPAAYTNAIDGAQIGPLAGSCGTAAYTGQTVIVGDIGADERWADYAALALSHDLRACWSLPILAQDGDVLGTFACYHRAPHWPDAQELACMRQMAHLASMALERLCRERNLRQSEERFRIVFEQSSDAHLLFGPGGIVDCNNAAIAMLRCENKAHVLDLQASDLSPEFQPDGSRSEDKQCEMSALARSRGCHRFEWMHRKMDGAIFPVEVTITPVAVLGESALLVVWHDLTERKAAEAAVRASEARLSEAQRMANLGSWEYDLVTGKIYFSEQMFRLYDLPPAAQAPDYNTVLAMYHPEDAALLESLIRRLGEEGCEYELDLRRVDAQAGTVRWHHARGRPCVDTQGRITRIVGTLMDITERKGGAQQMEAANCRLADANAQLEAANAQLEAANVRLQALATTDGLTGLQNHRAFQDRLREEHARAVRYHTPLSLLLLDVDRFKAYNDAHGHLAGDEVLRQVGQALRQEARLSDVVARYGGEEFALILPSTGGDEARALAERLRQAVAAFPFADSPLTVSVGIATLDLLTPSATALIGQADRALYRSKHRGRNCVTHSRDPHEHAALDTRTLASFNGLVRSVVAGQDDLPAPPSEPMRDMLLQSYNATIASWSRILDIRDKETEGHSERVTDMMVRLARHLGMSDEEVMLARWGAWLHDIGKMGVPDAILLKPGKLTDEEWSVMQQHTTLAYEMLAPIKFLGPAIDIPHCHHERWDGSGYPCGLKGEEIPLMARLFAVIDVYDALTSDRPYRRAWPTHKVLAHLREQAGSHFDPRAVSLFLEMLDQEQETAPPATDSRTV